MKILHTADWHLGRHLVDYSLLSDQRHFLTTLTNLISCHKPDVLIIAGDVYDRAVPPAEAVSLLNEFLQRWVKEYRLPVLMIAGNHDSADRLQFGSDLLEQAGLHIAATAPKTVSLTDTFGTVDFHLLPHFDLAALKSTLTPPPTSFSEGMERLLYQLTDDLSPDHRQVLVAHGFFAFGQEVLANAPELQVGGSQLLAVSDHPFDLVLLGHLHSGRFAGKAARYSGSPLKYAVDESLQKKGVDLITLTDTLSIETLPIVPLYDVQCRRGSFDTLLADPPQEDYLFFELTDKTPVPDAALRLKSRFPRFLGLRYLSKQAIPQATFATDSHTPLSFDLLFEEFYMQMTDTPLTKKQQTILAELEGLQ